MLPPNLYTIPQIQSERTTGSKLIHLTTLLEFLLKTYNPNVAAADRGRDPKVGERVLASKQVFSDFTRVLWALKVRNTVAHAIETDFTESDRRNAAECLVEAIGDVCRQPEIPRAIVAAVYAGTIAGTRNETEAEEARLRQQAAAAERQRKVVEEMRHRRDTRERDMANRNQAFVRWQGAALKLGLAGLLLAGGVALFPKGVALIWGDRQSAQVERTAAEQALRRARAKKRQAEYAVTIEQVEAAWRDAEIEFKKENYRKAEAKYRELISVWDQMNQRVAESSSFEDLLSEAQSLRKSALSAAAQEKAASSWNQAEEFRRNAEAARRSGDLHAAKELIIQARQQYEIAQATAAAAPSSASSPTPSPEASPMPSPAPSITPTPTPVPAPTLASSEEKSF